jgi:hypothetical protein
VVKRQTLLLPKFIADAEQLNSLRTWLSSNPNEQKTTGGRMRISRDDIEVFEEPLTTTLRYIEFRILSYQSK